MRPWISVFTIQRMDERFQTEFYDGCESARHDGWSTDPEDVCEFKTAARAQRRADRVGGEVFSHQRQATAFEAAMMARPIHTVSRRRAA